MGNIVGNQFGLVASKNQETAITDSKAAGNEAKFYITKNNSDNTGETCNAAGNAEDSIALTINGNVLRGMSKKQEETVNKYIGVNPATVYKFKGTVADYTALTKITSVKAGDVYNVTDPTSAGYPKETNFAATKDGTGATSGIWDSLGGISLTLATADTCRLLNDNKIAIETPQGTAANSIALVLGTNLTCAVNEEGNAVISAASIELSTGLSRDDHGKIYLSSDAITGSYLKSAGGYNQGAPFEFDETALDAHIKNKSILRAEISTQANNGAVVLDKGYLTIQVPSYVDNPDQAPDILCIATAQTKSSANGLYISSYKLAEFVNSLIHLAISSYLDAK